MPFSYPCNPTKIAASFGSVMDKRSYSAPDTDYKYGFNGMERDDEAKGEGNSYDFGARIYDSRLGRWMSVDPLANQMPDESPYIYVGNSPIIFIDPDGKKRIITHVYNHFKTEVDEKTGVKSLVKTGSTTVIVVKNNDLIAGPIHTYSSIDKHDYTIEYNWYDINETTTHTIIDGVETKKEKTETKGNLRTTTNFKWESWAKAKVDEKKFNGGVTWTSKNGQGLETRKGGGKLDMSNIDLLLAVLNTSSAAASSANSKKFIDGIKYVVDAMSTADEVQGNNLTMEDALSKLEGKGLYCTTCPKGANTYDSNGNPSKDDGKTKKDTIDIKDSKHP